MIDELWESFPRLLERNVNALLDCAEPAPIKAFHLYKSCQREGLWSRSFEEFARGLVAFYSIPRIRRSRSSLGDFLERPVGRLIYEDFELDFRSARVETPALHQVAVWSHHLIRVGFKFEHLIVSIDVLQKAIESLFGPASLIDGHEIEFEDFRHTWERTVERLYGRRYHPDVIRLRDEFHHLQRQIQDAEKRAEEKRVRPTIYLTQTEIDWTCHVRDAARAFLAAPKYPLSRGAQKPRLIDLDRTVALYNLVLETKMTTLQRHRENLRLTLIDRCEGLLQDKAA